MPALNKYSFIIILVLSFFLSNCQINPATGEKEWKARAAFLTPIAKAFGTDVGIKVSEDGVQVHGGMGFTWEFDCQFYYRRAKLLSLAVGSEKQWQGRLVDGLAASA